MSENYDYCLYCLSDLKEEAILRAIVARIEPDKLRLLMKQNVEFWPDDAGKAAEIICAYLKEGI